jgi:hypothetical protein
MAKQNQVTFEQEAINHEGRRLHEWRVAQLVRLGITESLAEVNADNVDWHQIARLVQSGCPPRLALRIAR